MPGAGRGELERGDVGGRLERAPRRDDADRTPPVRELQSRVGLAHDIGRPGRPQLPQGHFPDPTSSPDTKCRWNTKNTIAVGTAATSEPAAITFHEFE